MKSEITRKLEDAIWKVTRKQGTFGCFEVTIGWFGDERVDYLTYNTKGEWRCYEIKSSKADFFSSAKKTFVGHYNYYVVSPELYNQVKEDIPSYIGVYVNSTLVKRPKRQKLSVDEQVLKDSMIRSLFRDVEKYMLLKDKDTVSSYKKKIDSLQKEVSNSEKNYKRLVNSLRNKYGRNWEEVLEIDY